MTGTPLDSLTIDKPWLMLGDCLERMREIEDGSVDMIACDLPYQATACRWDELIPFEPLWTEYKRLIKGNGAIALTASQPFTTMLIASNYEWFKYCWYWRKARPAGWVNANRMPLKDIEEIAVFSTGTIANGSTRNMPYYPQGLISIEKEWKRPQRYTASDRGVNPTRKNHALRRTIKASGFPRQILDFAAPSRGRLHSCEKPVALFEYLVRTYTNPGEIVLDNCFGSGTTGVACANTGRRFIGIERDPTYFDIARRRIEQAIIAANQPAPFGGLFADLDAAE